MSKRSLLLVSRGKAMSNARDRERWQMLQIPVYESLKGTTAKERSNFLTRIEELEFVENNQIHNELSKQPKDYHHHNSIFLEYPMENVSSPPSREHKSPENFNVQCQIITSSVEKKGHVTRTLKFRKFQRRLIQNESLSSNDGQKHISTSTDSDEDPFYTSEEEYFPSSSGGNTSSEESDNECYLKENSTKHFHKNNLNKEKRNTVNKRLKCNVQGQNNITSEEVNSVLSVSNISNLTTLSKFSDMENSKALSNGHTVICRENREMREIDSTIESDEISEDANSVVTISVTKIKKDGKRLRDKRHCCYICNKMLTNNMARHFELIHKNDTEVAKILALPKRSSRRREEFEKLIRAGDFYYNCNVLSIKNGELVLVRRPQEQKKMSYEEFGPCPHCLGFMAKKYLWHHLRQCKSKRNKDKNTEFSEEARKGVMSESSAMIFEILGPTESEIFRSDIINSFRDDAISNKCKNDDLILKFGSFLYEKHGVSQAELIRQSMRQLSRLKIQLNEMLKGDRTLSQWLQPHNFDQIVSATKSLCRESYNSLEKLSNFDIPSLALKIGHLLRKCVAIESGSAIRRGLMERHREMQSFLELMDLEWATRISSKALTTLVRKKMNTAQLLPVTDDLLKLSTYLEDQMKKLKSLVGNNCTKYLWSHLATVTLSRIILFNKRRSGETAKMTLMNYSSRPSWSEQGTAEFKNSLTPLESELVRRLNIVEIRGKRGRTVPVILTDDMKCCIDVLIGTREKAGISPTNIYVFARSEGSQLFLRGHDCLRKVCAIVHLDHPEYITSTKLRKYIATVCQIFDLKENEMDWLAKHLGHDINVHRDFYRIHENVAEITKVSRLLLAVERGEAHKFAGKQLNDITIEDLPPLEEEEEDPVDQENNPQIEHIPMQNSSFLDSNFDNKVGSSTTEVSRTLYKERIPSNRLFQSAPADAGEKKIAKENRLKKNTLQTKRQRIPWTPEEINSVLTFFKFELKKELLPGKDKCTECIKQYPVLERRIWTDVKFYLKNYYARNHRLLAKDI